MFRHFFTPHHSNNHRPRILHPEMIIAIIVLFYVGHIGIRMTARSYPMILGYATNIVVQDLLLYTNQERLDQGLTALQLNPTLSRAAEKKAYDMFEDDYWAHVAPDGATPWDFIVSEGYTYTYAGENLARDFADSRGVVTAWMNSPSHRENILRDHYQEIGFAVVNGSLDGEETTLVVQMFGTPPGSAAAVDVAVTADEQPVAQVPAQVPPVQSASVQKPVIDQSNLQRSISFIIMGVIGTILVIDSFIIWKRKTIRIAGHNFAHVLFIVSILGLIVLSSRGSILASSL